MRRPAKSLAIPDAVESERFKGRAEEEDALLMKVAAAIPYESLDCPMKSVERTSDEDYSQNVFTRLLGSVNSTISATTQLATSTVDIFVGYACSYQNPNPASCFEDSLMDEVAGLKSSNTPQRLVGILGYLDSLGIQGGAFGESLYGEYLMLKSGAEYLGNPTSPDAPCLARQAYAYKMSLLAEAMLADTLISNPSLIADALEGLSPERRNALILACASILERGFDATEELYYSLPEEYRLVFLNGIGNAILLAYSENSIQASEQLAKDASDPSLKEAALHSFSERKAMVHKAESDEPSDNTSENTGDGVE